MPSLIEPGCDLIVCTWNISKRACPNQPAIERTLTRVVDHAKFKTTKIYSQGILVNYTKICTNENFPLYIMNIPRNRGCASLVPRPFLPPVFDCLQYAKTEGKALSILSCE